MDYIQRKLLRLQEEYGRLAETPSAVAGEKTCVRIKMSDGVQLYTVLQKPVGEGPFPTILMRSCYLPEEAVYCYHAYEYCIRGFAFVYQFCRGIGESGGEWVPNVHERQDGLDTLTWLAKQPWVESIGYFGCSYLALTGWSVADLLPDKVKTMYLTHYGTDRYFSAYSNGCFRQDVLTSWAMENTGAPVDADFYESAAYQPQCEVDEELWGCRLKWYRDWVTSTKRSDAYWQEGFWAELEQIPERVKVPVYLGEGWYDHHLGSALHTWMRLSPESRRHSTLRIGGWNHDFEPCIPGRKTENLQNSDVESAFYWFDRILRKKQLPDMQILTYTIGGDVWRLQEGYPFLPDQSRCFFLDAEGVLKEEPAEEAGVREYTYDPSHPVRSHGGEALLYSWDEIGSLTQPPAGWRPDVCSFVSDPLWEAFELLGAVRVSLWVSSDAEDTAFTVKLMEVMEDGTAYNIRSGVTTLACGRTAEAAEEYQPGSVVELKVTLWDIGWQMKGGSRLRLDISSSDFPQYHIHGNYSGVWSVQTGSKCARQKIYCGRQYPSCVELPIFSAYLSK